MDDPRSSDRLWLIFAISSVLSLAVLAVSPVKDYFREYRRYQEEYRRHRLAKAGSSRELRAAEAETVEIRQIWLPELDGRVDRCVSCHLGVADAGLGVTSPPFAPHPAVPHVPEDLDRFGCVACHRGQGRATEQAAAHGDVEGWSSPLLPLELTEASCGSCHRGETVPEAHLLSEGRRIVREAGCYACHEMAGRDGWRSDGPALDGLAEKTSTDWLRRWLEDPRAERPATPMPDFSLGEDEIEALVAFLWAQPPRALLDEAVHKPLPAGDPGRGKKLFRESRCISCHTVDGRGNGSAPELAGIGSRASGRWLVAFVEDPQAFHPDTPMPRYDLSREEVLDVTAYLLEELSDPEMSLAADDYRAPARLVEEGEAVFRKYGCGSCHALGAKHHTLPLGPDLTGVGGRAPSLLDFGSRDDLPRHLADWLAAKVSAPRSFREDLKMPEFGFTPDETRAVVTAVLADTGEALPAEYVVPAPAADYRPPGRFGALASAYRCLSCHQVQGAGGDLSTAPLTAVGSKTRKAWLEEYLLVPTTIRPLLTERMIPLWMPRDEAAFMADFMSNVYLDDSIPEELFSDGVPPERAERGRRLFFERYACQACHQLGGVGGYYGPPLDDTPRKLKPGWVAWWLQGPQRWRADVRCPDYGLERAEAEDLTAFLLSGASPAPAGRGGAR